MEVQFNEYIALSDVKPKILGEVKPKSSEGKMFGRIFFPVSVEHVNLNQYRGDARSFGYNFDEGECTVVSYEQVFGVLADDTVALLVECRKIAKNNKKPNFSILEFDDSSHLKCDTQNSELVVRYDSDYLYKDENGYWYKSDAYSRSDSTDYSVAPVRVTDESAELFLEVNAEYQRKVGLHNEKMKEAMANMTTLRSTITGKQNENQ